MAWIWLGVAGLFEILFAVFLKLSDGFTRPLYSVGFIVGAAISLYCLTRAMQIIPLGTAYTVWTGIGAAGVVLIGIAYFNEPVTLLRILLLSTLVGSIIGLKLITPA